MKEPRNLRKKEALQEILRYTRERQFDLATEELVKTFQDAVYGYCFNRLDHNHTRAEEAAQKTFIAAWKALPKARFAKGEASIAPWVYAIAKYKIMDEYRISPEIPVENPPEDPPEGLEPEISKLDWERVWKPVLMKLDPKKRQLLIWRALGYSGEEMADFLGITAGAVRILLCRADGIVRELKRELKES